MPAPIRHTCPDIDKIISAIKRAEEIADNLYWNFEDGSAEDIKKSIDEIRNELYGLPDMMETLRDANSALRDWGEKSEKEVIQLQKQLDETEPN